MWSRLLFLPLRSISSAEPDKERSHPPLNLLYLHLHQRTASKGPHSKTAYRNFPPSDSDSPARGSDPRKAPDQGYYHEEYHLIHYKLRPGHMVGSNALALPGTCRPNLQHSLQTSSNFPNTPDMLHSVLETVDQNNARKGRCRSLEYYEGELVYRPSRCLTYTKKHHQEL